MTISRSTSILSVLALCLPLMAQAQPDPGHGPDGGMPRMHGMPHPHGPEEGPPYLRALQLDEAQRDKVFSIMHGQAPQLREQHKAMDKARQALAELARSGQYSDAKAKPIADALGRASAEIALLHARADSQIQALLTPEQRARLAQLRQQGEAGPPGPGQERPPMR